MSYEEQRVRVRVYGRLSESTGLLVHVPGAKGAKIRLHAVAAAAFTAMGEAVKRDLDLDLAAASGWRAHRWRDREHYEKTLIERYGSVKEGQRWLAYDSPHETGLAVDIGVGGLWPDRKTAAAQRERPLHAWLVEHAHEYGWHPYKVEPWHWEYPLSLTTFRTGSPSTDDPDPPEDDVSFGEFEIDALEDTDLGEAPL